MSRYYTRSLQELLIETEISSVDVPVKDESLIDISSLENGNVSPGWGHPQQLPIDFCLVGKVGLWQIKTSSNCHLTYREPG